VKAGATITRNINIANGFEQYVKLVFFEIQHGFALHHKYRH